MNFRLGLYVNETNSEKLKGLSLYAIEINIKKTTTIPFEIARNIRQLLRQEVSMQQFIVYFTFQIL